MKTRKIPFWATFFTIFGMAILCALGFWQVQRLHWKTELLRTLDAEAAKDPATIRLGFSDLTPERNFHCGTIYGHYLNDREIALEPRTRDGAPGYHILTPFALEEDGIVLVNRGWVPLDKKDASARPESLISGNTWVSGTIRTPERANPFVPDNVPEKEQWFRVDLAQIAAARHLEKLAPVLLYANTTPEEVLYPAKDVLNIRPPNDHLSYALFWFAMAGVLGAIYVMRFFVNRAE